MESKNFLKLDANEGLCLLDSTQLARVLSPEIARRYPKAELLERELAKHFGLSPAQLIATAGADDAIERIFGALAGPGSTIVSTVPGFVEFLDASLRARARFVGIHKRPGSPFPLKSFCTAIKDEKPAIAVIASPDNPDGRVLSNGDFFAVASACQAAGTLFLLDLTYLDFADDSSILRLALETPGVLITGSFSKSRGLAGFRAGWAMAGKADRGLIDILRQAGPPFSLSSPAIEAAKIALEETETAYRAFVDRIKTERREIQEGLAALGAETWASQANFVSAFVGDAPAFVARLKDMGILIRHWPGKADTEGLVRITCPGEGKSLERLLGALQRPEVRL